MNISDMKTSARNQFFGQVTSIQQGAVNDEITLEIAGGHTIVAVITQDSTNRLGLQIGSHAFALIKASSLIVVAGDGAPGRFSARNCLQGRVEQLAVGGVHSEVVISLDGGATVTAIITNESSNALALQVGGMASVIFKASSVIIGVAT